MDQVRLTANRRDQVGTSAAQRVRREHAIPAIVYGQDKTPVSISVSQRDVLKAFHTKAGSNVIITLTIGGAKKADERTVIVKEIQHHPVHGGILHIDFHQISLKERIKVHVPIALKGEAVGVKQDGGVLEHFLRELEVECLPTDIPPHLDVEIAALKIGDAIHVKDIVVPSPVKIITDPALVVLSILPPHVEAAPEAPAEAPAEPELIRKKKEEEGAESAAPAEGAAKAEAKPEKAEPKKEKEGK